MNKIDGLGVTFFSMVAGAGVWSLGGVAQAGDFCGHEAEYDTSGGSCCGGEIPNGCNGVRCSYEGTAAEWSFNIHTYCGCAEHPDFVVRTQCRQLGATCDGCRSGGGGGS